MPHRTLCVTLVSLLLPSAAAAQDWTVIPLGTAARLNAIQHTSFSTRYLVGEGGTVFHSNTTRTVWTPIDVGTSVDLLAVHEPSSGQVWVGGATGTVRVRLSGIWNDRDIPSTLEHYVIFSSGSGTSYAVGSSGTIYRSTTFGTTWSQQAGGTVAALHDGAGGVHAYVVGDDGTILETTDAGDTWNPLPSGTTMDLHAFRTVANGALLAAGESGTMLRSTDDGASWTPISVPTVATIRDLDTSGQNANWVLACGDGGTLLRSTDAGLTWCHILTGTSTDLRAVDMVNNAEYIVAGEGGLLMRTTTSGGGCADVTSVPAPGATTGLVLSAAWPNPLRGMGAIRLSVEQDQIVEAVLVDAAGRRLADLHRGMVRAGAPVSLRLDARRFAAGVYFVRAAGESGVAGERIVIFD